MGKKSYRQEGRSLMDFSLDLLSRRRKFIVSLFFVHMIHAMGKFIFLHIRRCSVVWGNFPIAKCGLNCFEVCLCTLHPPSPNFASSSTENSWTSVAHAGKFLQVIYQIGNHAIYRRLTHFQHPNQILSNLSPQISSEINWKTLSQQQVWSIVRVSADKKLHTLRHHEQWTFCNGRGVKQQIYAREIFISPRTPRENLRKQ